MKYLIVLIASLALLAGCKTGPNGGLDDEANAQASETATEAPTREVRRRSESAQQAQADTTPRRAPPRADDPTIHLPRFQGSLTGEGLGLDMVLDGSSPEAFRDSLEMVALESSDEQYQLLDQALGILRHTNLAFRDLNTLYSHLDGMTGQEVIDYARQEARRR